jgi:anthranilate synthase/aminodeoxychorismate synthase-like glutamine amidotransferase
LARLSADRANFCGGEVGFVILVVDNHDSFTWNLVHCLAASQVEGEVRVVESDAVTCEDVLALRPRGVVLSPGPGRPEDAGVSLELVGRLAGRVPLLGVCLGHQVICAAFGGRVVHAPRLMHGRTSSLRHDGRGLFSGLPSPLEVARYHSLIVDATSLPDVLEATAFTEQGELMAVRHRRLPIESVQFHPESFLTRHGPQMIAQWVGSLSARSPLEAGGATLTAHV